MSLNDVCCVGRLKKPYVGSTKNIVNVSEGSQKIPSAIKVDNRVSTTGNYRAGLLSTFFQEFSKNTVAKRSKMSKLRAIFLILDFMESSEFNPFINRFGSIIIELYTCLTRHNHQTTAQKPIPQWKIDRLLNIHIFVSNIILEQYILSSQPFILSLSHTIALLRAYVCYSRHRRLKLQ